MQSVTLDMMHSSQTLAYITTPSLEPTAAILTPFWASYFEPYKVVPKGTTMRPKGTHCRRPEVWIDAYTYTRLFSLSRHHEPHPPEPFHPEP